MAQTRIQGILKNIELAVRRMFIRWLSSRSRRDTPTLPLPLGPKPTILFLRQDRLGDAIVSTPVLVAIRNHLPDAHFIMVLGNNNRDIAPLLPIDTEIFVYQKKPIADFLMLRRLRKRKIDVVIDLMDNPSATSSILVAAIGAHYSVGMEKENSSVYSVHVESVDRLQNHISRRLAQLVLPFGIEPQLVNLHPRLENVERTITARRLGLNTSAGHNDREPSIETFAMIAQQAIIDRLANEVLVFYHPKDIARAQTIVEQSKSNAVHLAPKTTSFAEFAELLATCEFVITPDTSALHICSALEIPVVGIYPLFPPDLHYWNPLGVDNEMIIHDSPVLSSLRPEPVIEALRRLSTRVHTDTHSTNSQTHVA